jgi:hypothetical protein
VSGVSLEAVLPSTEAVLLLFLSRLHLRFFLVCVSGDALSLVCAICAMAVLSQCAAASHILPLGRALLMRPVGQFFPCRFWALDFGSLPWKLWLRWLA